MYTKLQGYRSGIEGESRVPLHLPRNAQPIWLEGYAEGRDALRTGGQPLPHPTERAPRLVDAECVPA